MTFANLSPLWLAGGAVVLAALLFLLQRLRIRRQVVQVPALIFWRDAVQAAPARMLSERFRHWLAYLLALAIALSLWTAWSRPRLRPAADARLEIFYLDASAAMTADGDFAAARDALVADAEAVPADRRLVVLGDPWSTRLLSPGEDVALLAARLGGVRAAAFPSRFADWAGRWSTGGQPARLHYYGFADAAAAGRVALHSRMPIVSGYLAPAVSGNRGIVAFGAMPAASGAWDKADLLVRVAATDGRATDATALSFTRNGQSMTPTVASTGAGRFLLRDVAADGARIAVALRPGDGFAADDRAALRLPLRSRIAVAVMPGVPATIRAVVAADPALAVAAANAAQVVIRTAGDAAAPARVPTLTLLPAASQAETFRFNDRDGALAAVAPAALDRLGLGQLDAGTLADQLGRPIAVGMAQGPTRMISAWRELFDDGTSFARSRVMPLFVSRSIRWLAAPPPWIPYAAAGDGLVELGAADAGSQATAAPGLGTAVLPVAEDRSVAGTPVTIALTDAATTRAVAQAVPAAAPRDDAERGGASLDLPFTVLMLLAGLLLAIEWVLVQRGRMP